MTGRLSARLARLEVATKEPEPLQIIVEFVRPGGRVTGRLVLEDGKRIEQPVAAGEYSASARAASSPRVAS